MRALNGEASSDLQNAGQKAAEKMDPVRGQLCNWRWLLLAGRIQG